MDITAACRTIRRCNDYFCGEKTLPVEPGEVATAVNVVKTYLESVKCDGKPIDELLISATLLFTPQGMQWVMPFVMSAESFEASRRHARYG